MDRHLEGEELLRKFYAKHPGAKPTERELRRLADRMGLHDSAVSDAMGLAGYGKVHSDSWKNYFTNWLTYLMRSIVAAAAAVVPVRRAREPASENH